MLDFRIGTFLKLCETKSYTNTAKLLHITQPSVTQHIKYLQKRYQCQLFTYEGKTLRLTPEGEYLRRQAKAMSQNSEKVIADLQRMSARRKMLRFGCTKELGDAVVPNMIGKMLSQDKELDLSLQVENTQTLVEMLESGRVDFILVDKSFAKSHFASYAVAAEEFCGWAGPKYAQEAYGLTFKKVFREKLLLREEGSGSRAILEEILGRYNCDLSDFYATMLCNTASSIKTLTAADAGISFGFAAAMREDVENGRIQKLCFSDLSENRELVFLYLKENINADQCKVFFAKFKALWKEAK